MAFTGRSWDQSRSKRSQYRSHRVLTKKSKSENFEKVESEPRTSAVNSKRQ